MSYDDDDGGDGDGGAVGNGSGIDESEKEIPKLSIYTNSRSTAPSSHILGSRQEVRR